MSAWIAVFEHPYFAVTGDDGIFDIKNLPDGNYTLQAWHEKYGTQEQKITMKGGKLEVNFTFKADDKTNAEAQSQTILAMIKCPLCTK